MGILCADCPDTLYAVRKDSPLIIGIGQGAELYRQRCAGDSVLYPGHLPAEGPGNRRVDPGFHRVFNQELEPVEKEPERIQWDIDAAEKGGYEHFMMKEICEQPEALRKTISPRIRDGKIVLDDITLTKEQIQELHKVFIVACGTSYHVGVVAKYAFERLLKIPLEVDVASEFRYRDPILDDKTLVIIISQSGETADTLAALRMAKKRGCRILSIVNVVGSTIANESDDVLYTLGRPGDCRGLHQGLQHPAGGDLYDRPVHGGPAEHCQQGGYGPLYGGFAAPARAGGGVPEGTRRPSSILPPGTSTPTICTSSAGMWTTPRPLEASLKLKEISYIHSEAYTAGELKHGPISLLEDGTLVIAIATYQKLFDKMMSNVREVKARGAVVLGITVKEKEEALKQETDYQFCVPDITDFMLPSLSILPLQLFAYYVASMKGCDIDKPRNLAKSVLWNKFYLEGAVRQGGSLFVRFKELAKKCFSF